MKPFSENPSPASLAENSFMFKERIEGKPDAFFILTGAMKWNDMKGRYESGSFGDVDENSGLATGGKDRVFAAAELHAAYPEAIVVPMSRTRNDTIPTYAKIAEEELLRKKVNPEKIILEENSVNTITEYKEAARFIAKNKWTNIVFISSNWHLPRCKALFNHIENFADTEEEAEMLSGFVKAVQSREVTVQFIGSTDVLSQKSNHYKNLFDKIEEDPGILERKKLEEQALGQIGTGTYGSRSIPKKIYPNQM